MQFSLAVIIPAYNEEASIASVIHEIQSLTSSEKLHIEPIIINDCSTDRTADIITDLPCTAIHLPTNLGIGGAVQTGLLYARNNNFDFAVQVDGDGQHPAEKIIELVCFLQNEQLDVVIGSRYLSRKGFQSTRMRRFGIRYFSWINKQLTGQHISDSTSGFRLLNKKAIAAVCEIYPDEYPEPEALIIYHKLKLRVGEFPVEMRARKGGKSSIGTFTSIYYMLKVSLAILFTAVRKIK